MQLQIISWRKDNYVSTYEKCKIQFRAIRAGAQTNLHCYSCPAGLVVGVLVGVGSRWGLRDLPQKSRPQRPVSKHEKAEKNIATTSRMNVGHI